jgi:hypothetical protein
MLAPSVRCTPCVANTPPQVVRFPAAAPASPPITPSPEWLPYPEASPAQRHQLVVLTRQVLQAAYPTLQEQQWVQALEELQLPLYICREGVTLYGEALTTLVQYLATCYPTVPATDIFASPVPLPDDNGQEPRKQTFSIPAGLALQLKRVGYWKREPVAWLVQQALARLLRQYPEAFKPTPHE